MTDQPPPLTPSSGSGEPDPSSPAGNLGPAGPPPGWDPAQGAWGAAPPPQGWVFPPTGGYPPGAGPYGGQPRPSRVPLPRCPTTSAPSCWASWSFAAPGTAVGAVVVIGVTAVLALPAHLAQMIGLLVTYAEQRAHEAPVNTAGLATELG